MGKLIHLLAGLLLAPLFAAAAEDAAAPAAMPPPSAAEAPAPRGQGAARFAGAEVKGYVESLGARFAIRARALDPFGQNQDPDAKPVVKRTVAKGAQRAAVTATPFAEIVGYLQIAMVMPSERRFVLEGRTLGAGDQLALTFHNTRIEAEVIEVSAARIVFRNVATGETGAHRLDLLPQGITRGNLPDKVPGMIPLNSATPVEIQVPAPPPSGPNNP